MNKPTSKQPVKVNFKKIPPLLTYFVVGIVIFIFILLTGIQSYATDASAAIVTSLGGNGIVVREGTNRNVKPWNRDKNGNNFGELRRYMDTLEITGDSRSSANLNFISETTVVVDHAGLLIRTTPSNSNIEYRFPCGLVRGDLTIGWRKAGEDADRACNNGLAVGPGAVNQSYLPNSNYSAWKQAPKNTLVAQSSDDITIVPPDSNSRFIQAFADGNDIQTITLEGNILVKSAKHPQGRLISEGNKYSYPQDVITPIDCRAIANSPTIQQFLDPSSWGAANVNQRVADGIANQLADHRAGLCRASQSQIVWNLDFPQFVGNPLCSIAGRLNGSVVQTGSSLSGSGQVGRLVNGVPDFSQASAANLRGTITETKVQMVMESGLNLSIVFDGVKNQNGEITGTATLREGCNGLSGPFRMTQQN